MKTRWDTGRIWTFGSSLDLTNGGADDLSTASITVPAGVTEVDMLIIGLSSDNADDSLTVALGDAGGKETSGYYGTEAVFEAAANTLVEMDNAAGFIFACNDLLDAAVVARGRLKLVLADRATNLWTFDGTLHLDVPAQSIVGGRKALSAELSTVHFTLEAAAFDGGTVYWKYMK